MTDDHTGMEKGKPVAKQGTNITKLTELYVDSLVAQGLLDYPLLCEVLFAMAIAKGYRVEFKPCHNGANSGFKFIKL
jgi:hypothetical protein